MAKTPTLIQLFGYIFFFFSFSFALAQTKDSTDFFQNMTISDTNTTVFDENNEISDTNTAVFDENEVILDAENTIADSTTAAKKTKVHSPKIAGWMSMVPGLGQAYNKKYWKIPVIYVGFGGIGVGIAYFAVEYITFRDEYRRRLNESPPYNSRLLEDYPNISNLNAMKQGYQKNMELLIILAAVGYFFNILDAVVDAHLMGFNVSDDLSLNIVPSIGLNNSHLATTTKIAPTINLTFTLNFK